MKALFYAGNQFLGEGEMEPDLTPKGLSMLTSTVFVCPRCGEAWGRIQVEDRPWFPMSRSCAKHPTYSSDVAGSLLMLWDSKHNQALPVRAMNREVLLMIQHLERYPDAVYF